MVGADTTVTEDTDAAGGKMSWISQGFSDAAKWYGDGWKTVTSLGGLADNDVSRFFENEISNKSDLRGAQFESILSGVPVIGDIIQGLEGATQLEDLYNSTGKVPEYPGLGNSLSQAASGLSHQISKVADGKNDLYEYYSGSPDEFRSEMNMMYQ